MNPWISAIVGAVAGYALLGLTVLWMRKLCLPVSAHELKWQCDAGFWLIAAAYAVSTFVAVFLARRWKVAAGLIAFAVLFLGHSLAPHLALISFGKSWYLSKHTLLFAVIPAIVGAAAAVLPRGKSGAPAAASKCPEGKGLYPECLFIVAVSDSEITNQRPDGVVERLAVKDLKEVAIETNTSGPWGADVWWLLSGATPEARCAYPGGATGEQRMLQWLQGLPGFDDKSVIAAMGSTSNARFVCWRAAA